MSRNPRLFGRPVWVWASILTMDSAPGRDGVWRLRWRCHVARAVLWPICRRLTGHRMADGEYGYGGGGIDVFCRYCRFPWSVPVEEMPGQQFLADLFHSWPTPRGE